jgi:hypothetical protein
MNRNGMCGTGRIAKVHKQSYGRFFSLRARGYRLNLFEDGVAEKRYLPKDKKEVMFSPLYRS